MKPITKKFRKRKSAGNETAAAVSSLNSKKPSAKRKIMDILARRNLTAVELRRKLAIHEYSPAEIEEAINFADDNKWLVSPKELSQQLTEELTRKKKSARFIDYFLRDKGLPAVKLDPKAELDKALQIVTSKLSKDSGFDSDEKKKVQRLLTNRGFDSTTIRKVIERK